MTFWSRRIEKAAVMPTGVRKVMLFARTAMFRAEKDRDTEVVVTELLEE